MLKKRLWLVARILFVCAMIGGVGLLLLVSTNDQWARRAEAAPVYARVWLRQWRPTAAVPTPPPGTPDRERLLNPEHLLSPSPTLVATFTPPATVTPVPTHVVAQAATPVPPTATPAPSATPDLLPAEVYLDGVSYAPQMFNNCGPTTLAMNLSFYGIEQHQREPAAYLKPKSEDVNVSPEQIQAYARMQGMEAMIRVGGTVELLQQLLHAGFPVIVEDWILPEDRGGMGHYRLLIGYDRESGTFISEDSYFGSHERVGFRAFDQTWRVFNRKYIVVYRPDEAEAVADILGPMTDDDAMLAHALTVATTEAAAAADNAFTWFTLGTNYTLLGEHELAAEAFDEARRIGLPLRMLWYQFEPFISYIEVGRYDDAAHLAYATSYSASGHEEAYYYEGMAYIAKGEVPTGVSKLRKALDYNPNFEPAAAALADLGG